MAARYGLKVFVVSNQAIFVPDRPGIERVVVKGGLDVADDWIAERIGADDIAITADIPLADRCLRKGARVIGPEGPRLHRVSIGEALATRELLDTLRQSGFAGGGPGPVRPQGPVAVPLQARRDDPVDPPPHGPLTREPGQPRARLGARPAGRRRRPAGWATGRAGSSVQSRKRSSIDRR